MEWNKVEDSRDHQGCGSDGERPRMAKTAATYIRNST